jgi:hypothetical protein
LPPGCCRPRYASQSQSDRAAPGGSFGNDDHYPARKELSMPITISIKAKSHNRIVQEATDITLLNASIEASFPKEVTQEIIRGMVSQVVEKAMSEHLEDIDVKIIETNPSSP